MACRRRFACATTCVCYNASLKRPARATRVSNSPRTARNARRNLRLQPGEATSLWQLNSERSKACAIKHERNTPSQSITWLQFRDGEIKANAETRWAKQLGRFAHAGALCTQPGCRRSGLQRISAYFPVTSPLPAVPLGTLDAPPGTPGPLSYELVLSVSGFRSCSVLLPLWSSARM